MGDDDGRRSRLRFLLLLLRSECALERIVMACQDFFERLTQIPEEVPAISNLKSFGRSQSRSISKGSSTVARDQLDAGMRFEPCCEGIRRSVWQDINWDMPLEIHQHGSVALTLAPWSGKGNDVAIIPSPKNRTGRFLYIRLKPLVPPV
jgi:hypothetical protein